MIIRYIFILDTVLSLLASTDREATWWDGKRTEVWTIEVAIEGTRKRPVRGDSTQSHLRQLLSQLHLVPD